MYAEVRRGGGGAVNSEGGEGLETRHFPLQSWYGLALSRSTVPWQRAIVN
jgi:hypothetical protein